MFACTRKDTSGGAMWNVGMTCLLTQDNRVRWNPHMPQAAQVELLQPVRLKRKASTRENSKPTTRTHEVFCHAYSLANCGQDTTLRKVFA